MDQLLMLHPTQHHTPTSGHHMQCLTLPSAASEQPEMNPAALCCPFFTDLAIIDTDELVAFCFVVAFEANTAHL
jgi:hypothetical protein